MKYNTQTDESLYTLDSQEREQVREYYKDEWDKIKVCFKQQMKERRSLKSHVVMVFDIPRIDLNDYSEDDISWMVIPELEEAYNRISKSYDKTTKYSPKSKKKFSRYKIELKKMMSAFYDIIYVQKCKNPLVLKGIEYFLWKGPFTTPISGSPVNCFTGYLGEYFYKGIMECIYKGTHNFVKSKKDNDNGKDFIINNVNFDIKTRGMHGDFLFNEYDNYHFSLRDTQMKAHNESHYFIAGWCYLEKGRLFFTNIVPAKVKNKAEDPSVFNKHLFHRNDGQDVLVYRMINQSVKKWCLISFGNAYVEKYEQIKNCKVVQ